MDTDYHRWPFADDELASRIRREVPLRKRFGHPPHDFRAISPGSDLLAGYREDGVLAGVIILPSGQLAQLPKMGPHEPLYRYLHRRADAAKAVAKCYFIGGEEGLIKIGMSVDVRSRLRALQMSSPVRLSILAVTNGGAEREAAYHEQFAEFREYGEWFQRAPEIEAEIARLSNNVR